MLISSAPSTPSKGFKTAESIFNFELISSAKPGVDAAPPVNKIFKKKLKLEKKQHEREVSERNSRSGKDDGVRSESEQPKEPRQSKRQWFIGLLHKARALVRL